MTVPALANGTYTVAYRVVSADGHPVQGSYRFTVADPTATASPDAPAPVTPAAAVPSTTATSPTAASPAAAARDSDDGPGALILIGGGILLVMIIAAGAVIVMRRRSTRNPDRAADRAEATGETDDLARCNALLAAAAGAGRAAGHSDIAPEGGPVDSRGQPGTF
ncbi:copper resistance CopC family protein [Micromonospora thermarum]|uniref:Copper resistance protein CopC n=1 Tax=Micromonospora thermarum TaxID=2720024 RepID=A0ABX0ZCX0_9ACTN|nr:copper resistance protein CopC [Micromonospora thermarum]